MRYSNIFAIVLLTGIFLAATPQRQKVQDAKVTKVVVIAKTKTYSGPAPTTLEFVGTIFVNKQPATVEYQWERSDGAVGPRRKLTIRAAGEGVTDTWRLGAPGEHMRVWEKLHVLAPNEKLSGPAGVSLKFDKKAR
jgi:hypothetical protein